MYQFARVEILLEMKYQRTQHLIARLVDKENLLRAKLHDLDQQDRSMNKVAVSEIQAIGADMTWKLWADRARSRINMELSQILAQKENLLVGAKKEFAKLNVAKQTHATEKKKFRADRKAQELATILENQQLKR